MKGKQAKRTYEKKIFLPCGCPEHVIEFDYAEFFNSRFGNMNILIWQMVYYDKLGRMRKYKKPRVKGDVVLYYNRVDELAKYFKAIGNRLERYLKRIKNKPSYFTQPGQAYLEECKKKIKNLVN